MTHNICFILLAVDKENNKDPLEIWGQNLFVLAFPGECVNQLGSEVKSIPERSAGWFKTLDVWQRLMCDIKKNIFLLTWSLELIKPYHKLLHNCHVSSWRPHHPDFEIFDGSRPTQPLRCSWSSANRRCPNYIWVISNLTAGLDASYIRCLMVIPFNGLTIL